MFKQILPAIMLAAGTALSLFPSLGAPQVLNYLADLKTPPLEIRRLGGGIYLAKGEWGSNVGFYVANNEVLVIDAKTTEKATERVIQEIRRITDGPITRIIYTHSDPDSFYGHDAYPPSSEVICSLGMTKDWMRYYAFLLEMNAPLKVYESFPTSDFVPAVTFDGQLNIRIGQREVRLFHYGPAHTQGDTSVVFPDERLAFVGDLVFPGRDPIIQADKGGSCAGLIRTLGILLSLKPELRTYVPSHGDPVERDELRRSLESVEDIANKVTAMFEAGKSVAQVKEAFHVSPPPEEPGAWHWASFAVAFYNELTERRAR